ncbi:aminotransferase [Vararia minispora EC-137]|uniref:Aminotransferase n=1 Tax=Vararia minispora EC-137 TaxID=1314806 RepID=A0ACB8QQ78_9AGAM|nr:aminotransferase [Vararia minispora EC-137]
MATPDCAFSLITALRYDQALLSAPFNTSVNYGTPTPFLLLPYHADRLRSAAARHGGRWVQVAQSVTVESFERACMNAVKLHGGIGPFKVRFALATDGAQDVTVSPLPVLSHPEDPFRASSFIPDVSEHPSFTLHLDTAPTPSSIFTSTKTTHRKHYDAARIRHSLVWGQPADVLLYDAFSVLSETTTRNVAFYRSGRWLTPADPSGCLEGVTRRWLIEQGRVALDEDRLLRKDDVQEGEIALVFNAVDGCRLAIVRRGGN